MDIQEQHTAGPQSIGYDYQLFYFLYLILDLKMRQEIGFEVKDDIHIKKEDETIILFQTKHTTSKENLATLDMDLWKTLSNWADFIKADKNVLKTNVFVLVTNKSIKNNEFIKILFKSNKSIEGILSKLIELKAKTKSPVIAKYIENLVSLKKTTLEQFLQKFTIEIFDDIIKKIKIKILEKTYRKDVVDCIFDCLLSNIQQEKYLDIKNKKKFIITGKDFIKRYGRCFRIVHKDKPLPKRTYPIIMPKDLEKQIFIKQLIDIGEINSDSRQEIIKYTTQMLQLVKHVSDWEKSRCVLPTEMNEFRKESILKWENEFRAKYRKIARDIKAGVSISGLEPEIQKLGIELIDFLRRENLAIAEDTLGIELSNGYYYALSDKPEIGWHYDWRNKYK